MAMTCNIDSKGRSIRLIWGTFLLIVGSVMLGLGLTVWFSWIAWLIAGVCMVGGGFCVYEALVGWCALRAIGIKTPI